MREDIQFLRGYAVSIVLLLHSGFGPIAGYLGVDVFFVISGYLITKLVQNQIIDSCFNFKDFYLRRAKRLLPAAYATYIMTSVAAIFFLTSNELDNYFQQLIGAVTFTANFVLMFQTGYFERSAELVPLLHTWSLSLEEQYYIILPLLLVIVRPRLWRMIVVVILITSFCFCIYMSVNWPEFAFFMLPTRAWELSIGALVTLLRWDIIGPRTLLRFSFWPALACVVMVPFFPTGLPHPGVDAVLVCFGTAVVLANRHSFFDRVVQLRAVARVGDASYSLYLTHWPVLAFINNAYLGVAPPGARIVALAVGVALGVALYFLVERPTHRSRFRPTIRGALIGAGLATCLAFAPVALGLWLAAQGPDYAALRSTNYGLDERCDQNGAMFKAIRPCRTSKTPEIAVWGDSFAMQIVPGLLASGDLPMVQATRTSCPPVIGYSHFNDSTRYTEQWAHRCVEFNDQVMAYLKATPSIETVILGATFKAFTMSAPWQAVVERDGDVDVGPIDTALSLTVLVDTVRALEAIGKRVVVFAPPPSSGRDTSECAERKAAGLVLFDEEGCEISMRRDQQRYGLELALLNAVQRATGITVVDPRKWMCDLENCRIMEGVTPLYRDSLHLSVEGSRILGAENNWSRLIGWSPSRFEQ